MHYKFLKFCLIASLFISCNQNSKAEQAPATDVSEAFNTMLNNYYEDGLKLNPLNATMAGDNRYNDYLPNTLSDEFVAESKAYYNKYLKALSTFKNEDLSPSEQMSKSILQWECEINLSSYNYKSDLRPIDQMWSLHLTIGQLASGQGMQPFNTVEDYNNWLKRLDGFIAWLHSAEAKMKEGATTGNVLPKSLVVKVLPQLLAGANKDVEQHLYYGPIRNFPEGFSDADKAQLTKAYSEKIANEITPAFQSLYDYMSGDYMAVARASSGIDAIPNGEAFYKHMIKLYTTTNMSADEIHQLGLNEVARIRGEMEKVMAEVGFTGTLEAFFDDVRSNPKLMPFTDPQQVIDNFNAIHQRMIPQLEQLFNTAPKTPFEVRRIEAFRENSASAHYNPGSLEANRPGVFYTPIPNVRYYNVHQDETLFLHEAIPGHHYQIALTQENEDLPLFRKNLWYSGYGEGWALYAESLGKELGLYTDPYQYFGTLAAEMHRAIRLVVDTGLHSKGWTREQAIQYSLENESVSEAGITSEIERYMAMPAQALSYKIGQLQIRALRDKAQQELGDQFNIGDFHEQVLETGCVPLALLEEKINIWIATNK